MHRLPSDDVEKQEILEKVISLFEEGKEYTEEEVYKKIKDFKVEDYVLVARELVNFGYFGKDSYKSIFWVKKNKLSEEELETIRNFGKEE